MNEASEWRFERAVRVSQAYAAHPQVAAVFVGGSTARGHADPYSDIELGVFWWSPPTMDDRQKIVAGIGADILRLYPYDPEEELWSDDFMLGRSAGNRPRSGIFIEIASHTVPFMNQVMDAVLVQHTPDLLKQNLLAGLLQGIPVAGEALLEKWRARAAKYPRALATAVVRQHAQIDHYWRWRMWLERDNLLMLQQQMTTVQIRLLHLLLGLNREYYFGFKWLDLVLSKFDLTPDRFAERFKALATQPAAEAAPALAVLVEETYDLIADHLPEVNVVRLRRIFRWQRPVWEMPPPLPSTHSSAAGSG